MARPLLVLLLLLNYLLVVCASATQRPDQLAERSFDYVHSPNCQQKNAWRGGACFDDCNGVQYQVHKGHKPIPLQQLLTSLKGLDLHCLPTVAAISPAGAWQRAAGWQPASLARVPGGVRGASRPHPAGDKPRGRLPRRSVRLISPSVPPVCIGRPPYLFISWTFYFLNPLPMQRLQWLCAYPGQLRAQRQSA